MSTRTALLVAYALPSQACGGHSARCVHGRSASTRMHLLPGTHQYDPWPLHQRQVAYPASARHWVPVPGKGERGDIGPVPQAPSTSVS